LDVQLKPALATDGPDTAGPIPNVMESRMIRPSNPIATTVEDLRPPKVHPSNVGEELPKRPDANKAPFNEPPTTAALKDKAGEPLLDAAQAPESAEPDTRRPGDPGKDARSRASQKGIKSRKKIAFDRMSSEEYDPLRDLLQADERAAFLEDKELPKDIDWHHTRQSSADPSMADVPEHIQPVSYLEHRFDEHSARPGDVPTAGIRDVTSPKQPIYDPDAPEVRASRANPNEPVSKGTWEDIGASEREFGKRAPPNFKDLPKVRDPALKAKYDYQEKEDAGVWRHQRGTKTWDFEPKPTSRIGPGGTSPVRRKR
jgi:hypothetical protein